MKTIQLLLLALLSINFSFASAVHAPLPQRAATMDAPLLERHTAVPLPTPEAAKPNLSLEKIDVKQEEPIRKVEPLAQISFLAGLVTFLSLVAAFLGVSFPVGISLLLAGVMLAAIVCGIIALIKIGKHKEKFKGKGFAIAGIALGVFPIVLWAVVIAILIAALQ